MAFRPVNNDRAAIRRIFQGQPDAFRHIIERYQPVVYAVALAQSGNVAAADKVTVSTFRMAFDRLVSITDAGKLGHWLCALAQGEMDKVLAHRGADRFAPRDRDPSSVAVDLNWLQTELMDPLNEELGPFSMQERKGLLLHVLCGKSSRQIAGLLKIEPKEAAEDLARTLENVEKSLRKEVASALAPELANKERMVHIMREVAGDTAAIKAGKDTHLGRAKRRGVSPVALAAGFAALAAVVIGGYFAYAAFFAPADPAEPVTTASGTEPEAPAAPETPSAPTDPGSPPETPAAPPEGEAPAPPEGTPAAAPTPGTPAMPTNYALQGRVGDKRFGDGIPGLLVTVYDVDAAGQIITDPGPDGVPDLTRQLGPSATTDLYGAFEITGVTRGEHKVAISHEGRLLAHDVRLVTDRKNPRVDIDIVGRVPLRFAVRGRVTDAGTGQPIPDFEIAACKDWHQSLQPYVLDEFRAQSDAGGGFTEQFQIMDEYTLYARAHGYAPLGVPFSLTDTWNADTVLEFPLLRSAVIKGKVYGANELTVSGVRVMPRQGTPEGTVRGKLQYASTDNRGEFSVYTLPIGPNWFLFDHREYGSGRAVIVTEPGKVTEVKIQLPRKGSITGDVVVDGLPAQFTEFRVTSGSTVGSRVLEPEYSTPGQYELSKLPPGQVFVAARVAPSPSDPWFDRVYEQKGVVDLSQVTWMDFVYASGACSVGGAISHQGGAPRSAFVEVTLFRGENAVERLLIEASGSGTYTCPGIPAGKGEVTLFASTKSISRKDFPAARGGMERKTVPFEVLEGQQAVVDVAL
ncbi:MAG TPA: hypothetical protein PL005_05250 [Candidatus Hydrogenedentes bacterium]|nr:hypothetical protein [Candidatus Hydrogenedentota bacterium]